MALHLVPALSQIIEFFILERKYSEQQIKKQAPLVLIAAGISYVSWAEYCASKNGSCKCDRFVDWFQPSNDVPSSLPLPHDKSATYKARDILSNDGTRLPFTLNS